MARLGASSLALPGNPQDKHAVTVRTRFAPSPNGLLHLGHAYAAVVAHDLARERGGEFLLRIEDIDGTRSRAELVGEILADLEWLGLGWDGPVVFQSERLASYAAAGERLKAMGRAYIQFAMQNPDIYQLLFIMKEPLEHVANCFEDWHEGDRAFDILLRTVSECQEVGYFQGLDKMMLSFSIWSTMHGMCTLRISGHLGHVAIARANQLDLDHLISAAYETYVATLEKLKS